MHHAVFIMNCVPNIVLHNKSLYQCLYNRDPELHDLKTFGTLTYASIIQEHRTKLDHRGRKCIFLGYMQGIKGVVLLDVNSN